MDSELKILVLDDDDVIRENLLAYIEDEGYEVDGFASAEEALKDFESDKYAAGIIDMRLPGIDGSEFILKANEKDKNIKFLIHTGSTNFVLSDALKDIGLTSEQVMLKPVKDMQLIIDEINKLLGEG